MTNTRSAGICGCCVSVGVGTPRRIHNPPGQPAIGYRMGRHGDFLASIQARLSSSDYPALAALDSHEPSDFTRALADALASSLDLLTFYAERTANEHYLCTAKERLSVRELARLIGYRLAPGLAASTHLAFTLQALSGEPEQRITIPVGTRVQSVPGQDEQAQTFETTAAIEARAGWNAIPVQQDIPWRPRRGDTEMWLTGLDNRLAPGDAILIVGAEREVDPNDEHWDVRILSSVGLDLPGRRTHITWAEPLGSRVPPMDPAATGVQVFVLRQRTALFGHNAPDPNLLGNKDSNIDDLIDKPSGKPWRWKNFRLDPHRLDLATDNPKITVDSWIALVSNESWVGHPTLPGYVELYRVARVSQVNRSDFGLSTTVTRIRPDGEENLIPARFGLRKTLVLAQSEALTPAATPLRHPVYGSALILDRRVDDLQPGQALALAGPGQRIAVAPGVQGLELVTDDGHEVALTEGDELFLLAPPERLTPINVTHIHFQPVQRPPLTLPTPWNPPHIVPDLRPLVVPVVPGRMTRSAEEVTGTRSNGPADPRPVSATPSTAAQQRVFYTTTILEAEDLAKLLGNGTDRLRLRMADRDGRQGTLEAQGDQLMLATNRENDPLQREIAFIATDGDAIDRDRDHSRLRLQAPLQHVYARPGLRLNANVAPASHGETVEEILGSGDAGQSDQQFTLAQTPLTYVSAANPSGSASTLELRVNDLLWQERPSLYAAPPAARVYTTWQDDAARTRLQFGDGQEGARLPSGESNLRVKYRKGLGRAGNVGAGRLTTLLARPLGVSGVVNPVATRGGEDAETLDRAREKAPLTVLTLERAVSVQDYADFARAFAGIDKAHALWIVSGPSQGLFLTVAGGAGVAVPAKVRDNLQRVLRDYGDPLIPLQIHNYRDGRFHCKLSLKVDAAHEKDAVWEAVRQAVRAAFAFARRRFGQGVSVDEVAAVAQTVDGVVAAHVSQLYRAGQSPTRQPRLFAALPVASPTAPTLPAELLWLADGPIGLEEMA